MKLQTLGILCYFTLGTFASKFDRSVLYQPGPPGKPGYVSKKGVRGRPGFQVPAGITGHSGRGQETGDMGPFGPPAASGQVGLPGIVSASSYVGDNQEKRQASQNHKILRIPTGSSSRSYNGYGPPYRSSYLSYKPYLFAPSSTIRKTNIVNTNINNQVKKAKVSSGSSCAGPGCRS